MLLLCSWEKYINVLFTKGMEEWNDLVYIYVYGNVAHDMWIINDLYFNDYLHILIAVYSGITFYKFI